MTLSLKIDDYNWTAEHTLDVLKICFLAVPEEITTALDLNEKTLLPLVNEEVRRLTMIPLSPFSK